MWQGSSIGTWSWPRGRTWDLGWWPGLMTGWPAATMRSSSSTHVTKIGSSPGRCCGGWPGVDRPLLLDVATGTGRVPLALLRNRFAATGGRIVGLDLSWGMLRQARAKLQDYDRWVDLVWQDASHLPFDDGTFDAVTCMEALEFLPRPREALAEMVRVLAPGGLLAVTNRVGVWRAPAARPGYLPAAFPAGAGRPISVPDRDSALASGL